MKGRIWFEGNPWPNGHAIKSAELFIILSEGEAHSWPPESGAYLGLSIQTDDYYAEMSDEEQNKASQIEELAFENNTHIEDWNSFGAWQNFHNCTMESSNAQIGTPSRPYDITNLMRGKLSFEVGRKVVADQESDMNAFTCYILGHDSVADHELTFTDTPESRAHFDINWTGSIALSYVGNYNFEHKFRVELSNVPFIGIKGPRYQDWRTQKSFLGLSRKASWYDLRQDISSLSREKALRELASTCLKMGITYETRQGKNPV